MQKPYSSRASGSSAGSPSGSRSFFRGAGRGGVFGAPGVFEDAPGAGVEEGPRLE